MKIHPKKLINPLIFSLIFDIMYVWKILEAIFLGGNQLNGETNRPNYDS